MARKTSSQKNKRRQGRLARIVPLLKRFGLALLILIAVIWLGSWFVLSGRATRAKDGVVQFRNVRMAAFGFEVKNVLVEGRNFADRDILMALLNVEKGSPLFAFDPQEVKDQIEKMQWVKSAKVERRWPDTIYIELTEREPLALWQNEGALYLLDTENGIINTDHLKQFRDLVTIMGQGSKEQARDIIVLLQSEPDLYPRVDHVKLISGRRWDVVFKNKMVVKLPEEDAGLAYAKLAKLQAEQNILDKVITSVDLRDPARMIVKTPSGAAQEYDFLSGAPKGQTNI